jgi:YHS domain-containing protein
VVTLGAPFGDFVTVTSGLNVGDKVVTSGNFLIDSESKMRSSTLVSPSVIEDEHPSSERNDTLALRDPVCGMQLDSNSVSSAGHSEEYQGELFHFCSDKCQKKFQQDPGKYASVKVGSLMGPAHAAKPE